MMTQRNHPRVHVLRKNVAASELGTVLRDELTRRGVLVLEVTGVALRAREEEGREESARVREETIGAE